MATRPRLGAGGAGWLLSAGVLGWAVGFGWWMGPAKAQDSPEPSPTATVDAAGWRRLPAGLLDYAPVGLPDFDQRQGAWRVKDPMRTTWTHDGPVAAVNTLWWLDSRMEPDPQPPGEPHDGFDLVTAQGPWDDHSPENALPLVSQMAVAAGTNGPNQVLAIGTCLDRLADAMGSVLAASKEREHFAVRRLNMPRLVALDEALSRSEPTVLLLGLWQHHDLVGWQRLGGHYVALEAVDTVVGRIRIADPYLDRSEPAGDTSEHNDASRVSHDTYVVAPSLRAGPVLRLDGYLDAPVDVPAFVANFATLNSLNCEALDTAWLEGATLELQIEAALIVEPAIPPTETPTPTATPTATATATELVTATATLTGTLEITTTATLEPTATVADTDTPTSTQTATSTPSATPTSTSTATSEPPPTDSPTPLPTPTPTLTIEPTASPTEVPPSEGLLCGRVTEQQSGRALAGVEVSVWKAENEIGRYVSARDGSYCLPALPVGVLALRVALPHCQPVERLVEIAPGDNWLDVTLTCRPAGVYLPFAAVSRPRARSR